MYVSGNLYSTFRPNSFLKVLFKRPEYVWQDVMYIPVDMHLHTCAFDVIHIHKCMHM